VVHFKKMYFLFFSFFLGCAQLPIKSEPQVVVASPIQPPDLPSVEITVLGRKLQETWFDFPITINARVEYWIDYFCGKGRSYFAKYLERSEYFIPYIEPILKQNGLPADLVYLAMIESGFNNLARSQAKAVGPWQFITATGRRYGLQVNGWVDERRDIQKSTLSAVGYLRDLYSMFQSWELAAAAYNAGEAKIARAIRRYGTKDFWIIARQRFLKSETRDYVPKIIAAAILSKNRTQFGFSEKKIRPSVEEVIAGDGQVVKVVKTDHVVPEDALSEVREDGFLEEEATILDSRDSKVLEVVSDQPLAKPIPTPHITKTGEVGGEELIEFEVKSPADLLKVASAAGLSYQTVKALNPEILRWCTPPHLGTYRLKLPASTKEKFLKTYNQESYSKAVEFVSYHVKRGETLAGVARRYGIKVDLMSDLNGLSARSPLKRGSKILLPIPIDRAQSLSALDLLDPPDRRNRRRRRRSRVRSQRYDEFMLDKKKQG